jgi:hypothetical protein
MEIDERDEQSEAQFTDANNAAHNTKKIRIWYTRTPGYAMLCRASLVRGTFGNAEELLVRLACAFLEHGVAESAGFLSVVEQALTAALSFPFYILHSISDWTIN